MIHRLLFGAALALMAIGFGGDQLRDWVRDTTLPPLVFETSVEVLDRDGMLLRAYPVENGIWRLATDVSDVDPTFVEMLLAVEDQRFRTHNGVDLLAVIRAAGQAVGNGRIVSGASTLTMQTARLIENSGTGGWFGKLRQIRVALALETRLSKSQILSLYLTNAPFGGNLEGVRAASYAWFSKPPRRLSPEESALLVALPQAPTARRPDRSPQAATLARDRILHNLGHEPARRPVPNAQSPFPRLAPHLADRARAELSRANFGRRTPHLTINSSLQERIEALASRATDGLPDQTSAAILVADHQSGDILAYVGSARYGRGQNAGFVDMIRAVRSPGSTLKPLIYGLAFDLGLAHPETLISDTPVSFQGYAPQNFDGYFRGDVTVRAALENSLNIPPVRLTHAMGPARLIAGLERSGASPKFRGAAPGLAIALGGMGLTLEDLVQLYAAIAAGGDARNLRWAMDAPSETGPRLMSKASSWQLGHILAGIQPPSGQARGQVAFKTGTSYGHRDAWAIGFDGQHVIGVWLGRPDGTPVPGIFGGDIAAPILFEAFDRVTPLRTALPTPPPETLMVPNALLPRPLQRFGGSVTRADEDFAIAFPPDGAGLRNHGQGDVVFKLRGGVPPYVVLANNRPVLSGLRQREFTVSGLENGFSQLTVLDSQGAADQVQIRLD